MDLDEYLWRNKLSKKKVVEDTGIPYQALMDSYNKKRSFTLLNAFVIHEYTNRVVPMMKLLNVADTEKFNKRIKVFKTVH